MIQISHELTPQLFNECDKHNDYDFILPTFWTKNKEYKEHYKNSTKFKILDNGLYENDHFTNPEFIDIIKEIEPDIFIVPDVWNNSGLTLRNAKYWYNTLKYQLPSKTKLMVVMQGNTFGEFELLYQECKDLGYKHFAFNFSSRCYSLMFNHPNHLLKQMWGRIETIGFLKSTQYVEDNDYIHLLGCSIPQEFCYYPKEWKFIKSIDTSSPIINGALGIKYEDYGLLTKPEEKLEEFFEKDLSSKIPFINYNIKKFKSFVNGRH